MELQNFVVRSYTDNRRNCRWQENFHEKQNFVSSRKWKKRIIVSTLYVPDVPTAEGNVAGPGQHQRRGVVQAPGQLTAEDAQVQWQTNPVNCPFLSIVISLCLPQKNRPPCSKRACIMMYTCVLCNAVMVYFQRLFTLTYMTYELGRQWLLYTGTVSADFREVARVRCSLLCFCLHTMFS